MRGSISCTTGCRPWNMAFTLRERRGLVTMHTCVHGIHLQGAKLGRGRGREDPSDVTHRTISPHSDATHRTLCSTRRMHTCVYGHKLLRHVRQATELHMYRVAIHVGRGPRVGARGGVMAGARCSSAGKEASRGRPKKACPRRLGLESRRGSQSESPILESGRARARVNARDRHRAR